MGVTWDESIPADDTVISKTAVIAVENVEKNGSPAPLVSPSAVPSAPTLLESPTPPSSAYRHRSVSDLSQISLASTTDSIASTASQVSTTRQRDFERLFGPQLRPRRLNERPADFLTVLQTQSADLQASVLLHGRLYLTAYHLCFRSNIVGYVTERIYPLGEIVKVERSTTAKWIQNAVSLTFVNADGEDEVVGYGSMKDREAMCEGIIEVWKVRAPERYAAFMRPEAVEERAESERSASMNTVRGAEGAVAPLSPSKAEGSGSKAEGSESKVNGGRPRAVSEVKHTEASGERYGEVALDVKIPIPMDQLFKLMYYNKEFQMEFLSVTQKLTDVQVSDWEDVGGMQERKMTYVMHMNNRIGPKKSDCIGLERIEENDPDKAYEIVSETQTPDIPSGKNFKIRTRTCLSHTGADNNETPATRLYCTTQCDWSASSMLKSTITPAVIKGQKEYHQKLLAALQEWIKAHPDDFETGPAGGSGSGEVAAAGAGSVEQNEKGSLSEKSGVGEAVHSGGVTVQKGTVEQVSDIPGNQAMSWITILCALSLALNLYLLTRRC